ncbi:MAG: DUF2911 domain-containing protein [Bacteroidetes bacterium]|nr:DUF2911 domain-containing protein [Bacteroidota bacterium]MDA1121288.1 DUF2911 domain-containing protein [Bacteroidota bacterium]
MNHKIHLTKGSIFSGLILLCLIIIGANSFQRIDKSPMDMAYFPNNFAHDRKGDEKPFIRVIYSRPSKNDRDIFGKLVPFDKVWRTGANESTEIKFYTDASINGQKIKAGTYSLFTIPGEKEWTIIFNNDLDYWGAFSYNEKNDFLRVTASSTQTNQINEEFTIQFGKNGGNKAVMKMSWDKTAVELPIEF